jgi:tRNA (uracil-5-)-methyltransferase TRM9
MDTSTAQKLLQLNAEFYQTFAIQFSDTRQRLQPGVLRVLKCIAPESSILDLGCGNGELAQTLARSGFRGRYLGLDFSAELLAVARQGVAGFSNFSFIQGNLGDPGWQADLSDRHSSVERDRQPDFDVIFAFAALHHLPGRETYLQILKTVRSLLAPDGRFIHSNWQFLNSERLRQRLHPWNEIGLTDEDVDPGDYLLDWRRGGFGLRYVHHFSEEELFALSKETWFRVVESFFSDGEGGNLGLYQIWEVDVQLPN